MATTTTNYGFDVPTSSDLVKNGATAISTLGQDLDTFLFRPFSKNAVINGAMDIWQRGTSIAGTTTSFSADRWQSYRAVAGSTFSRQTGPEAIQYCVRVQRDSGNSSTTGIFLSQNFETVNSIPLAGKTVTLSFYARKGADYSRASSGLTVNLSTGTGTDQNGLTGSYTGSVTAINQTATLTTSWQRFTYSATLGSTATEINITYSFTPVGTAGAADYYEISGVQLEDGSQATPFSRMAATLQGELAACQRYYYRVTADRAFSVLASGFASSTTVARLTTPFPVTMRVQPTAVEWTTLSLQDYTSSWPITDLGMGVDTSYGSKFQAAGSAVVTSGLTAFRPYSLIATNSTSAYIGWSAEL